MKRRKKITSILLALFVISVLGTMIHVLGASAFFLDEDDDVYVVHTEMGGVLECEGPTSSYPHFDVSTIMWELDTTMEKYEFKVQYNHNLQGNALTNTLELYLYFDISGLNPSGAISSTGFEEIKSHAGDTSRYNFYLTITQSNGAFYTWVNFADGTGISQAGVNDDDTIYFYVAKSLIDGISNVQDVGQWRVFGYSMNPQQITSQRTDEFWDIINWEEFKTKIFDARCSGNDDGQGGGINLEEREIPGYPLAILGLISIGIIMIRINKNNKRNKN